MNAHALPSFPGKKVDPDEFLSSIPESIRDRYYNDPFVQRSLMNSFCEGKSRDEVLTDLIINLFKLQDDLCEKAFPALNTEQYFSMLSILMPSLPSFFSKKNTRRRRVE